LARQLVSLVRVPRWAAGAVELSTARRMGQILLPYLCLLACGLLPVLLGPIFDRVVTYKILLTLAPGITAWLLLGAVLGVLLGSARLIAWCRRRRAADGVPRMAWMSTDSR
jgi:hypothetical protein